MQPGQKDGWIFFSSSDYEFEEFISHKVSAVLQIDTFTGNSPLILVGFASEELGQGGDGAEVAEVTPGRRGESYSKNRCLQETQKRDVMYQKFTFFLIRQKKQFLRSFLMINNLKTIK